MRDPLDIARNAAEHAIAEGTRKDERDRPSEITWLQRSQAFTFISIAESLREIIEWAAIGDDSDAAVLGESINARTPLTVTDDEPEPHVQITVTGGCGHVLGTWTDTIDEKYPSFCLECDETLQGKYPWKITTELVPADPPVATPQPAEPLVMCGEPDGDSEPCRLLPGHEGGHLAYFPVERHPEDPEPTAPPISPRPYVPAPELLP